MVTEERARAVDVTVTKPHLAMQRGAWVVYASGRDDLDRAALGWVLGRRIVGLFRSGSG